MGHLPVWDVHFPVVPPGQRKGDGVTSSKHGGDVGLHHLQGEGHGSDRGLQPRPPSVLPTSSSPTLLTGMKPRESRAMPLCLRKPVAGTAPNGTEVVHLHSGPIFLLPVPLQPAPDQSPTGYPPGVLMNPTLCAPIHRLCISLVPGAVCPHRCYRTLLWGSTNHASLGLCCQLGSSPMSAGIGTNQRLICALCISW